MAARTILTDTVVKQIAILTSQRKEQQEIADRLAISQASVSRGLRAARSRGWLYDSPYCALDHAEVAQLEHLIHQPELLKALQQEQPDGDRNLRRLRILYAGEYPASFKSPGLDRYREVFGGLAAEHLVDHVFPGVSSVGVTWGGTLLAIARAVEHAVPTRWRAEQNIDFLPACGSPPDAIRYPMRLSPHLVALFDEHVNRTHSNLLNFTGVPAAIPRAFSEDEKKVLHKLFRMQSGYATVFGDGSKRGRIADVDAVLTSVGSAVRDEDPWIDDAAEAAGVDPAEFTGCVLGNMGGWFLPRENATAAQRQLVDDVNQNWTGITPDHYLACNRRVRPDAPRSGQLQGSKTLPSSGPADRPGGTILAAFGPKAEIVLGCVRMGLVTELLIDVVVAAGLRRALQI